MQFFYDPATRVYTRSGPQMQDPRNPNEFLPVLFATPDPLPTLSENEAARRLPDDSAWEVVEDYRGNAWHTDTKKLTTITDVGPLPAGITHIAPGIYDVWDGVKWVKDAAAELADLRIAAAAVVRDAFNQAITQPVPANGTEWNGGMDSALAIDGAVRLAEQMDQTSIDLFDAANQTYSVDTATGTTIAAAVAADYQQKLAQKQQLLRDIAKANADQLPALVWVD